MIAKMAVFLAVFLTFCENDDKKPKMLLRFVELC